MRTSERILLSVVCIVRVSDTMKTPITISMLDEIALRELNLFWMSRSLGRWVIA